MTTRFTKCKYEKRYRRAKRKERRAKEELCHEVRKEIGGGSERRDEKRKKGMARGKGVS